MKVFVSSYILMPVPDDGFTEKPKTCGTFWTINILPENITVIYNASIYFKSNV